MRKEKLIAQAKASGLLVEESKVGEHVLSTTIRGAGGRFICVFDDGRVLRDWPTDLPKRISVKAAAAYLESMSK